MKLLLFTDSLGSGGAQRQLVGLAVMLKERGYDVKVCTYYDMDFYKHYLDENNVPNELIPGAENNKKRILAVRKYFRKEYPDWVIAYQETPSLIACAAKVLGCNYKLIVSERNTTQAIGMNTRVRFFLYQWADTIVPNSHSQEKYMLEHHPWMKTKIRTITNFVDTCKFHPVQHDKHTVPEILVVGSIADSKNTKGFIKACKLLKDQGIHFHATWYGWHDAPTSYMNEVRDLIKELNVSDYVEIKNKTSDIAHVYQSADIFCIPSFFEGTPNVLCEAISSGLPVASSNVCDNPIYAQENVNGYLFSPSNINEMATALFRLISSDTMSYRSFSSNSRKIAEEKLSRRVFLSKYLAIIETKYMNGIVLGQSTKMAETLAGFCNNVYLVIDTHAHCSRYFKEIDNYPLIKSDTSMFTPKGIIPRVFELRKWIREYDLDVVFSQTKYDMVASKIASYFVRKKVVLLGTSHNSFAWLNDSAVRKMSLLIKHTTDCYIALASFVYDKLKVLGHKEERMLLLPNTIEYNEWSIKQNYALGSKIRMVYVAYVAPGKRQHLLVQIIEKLSEKYNVEVDCYGDLKYQEYVEEITYLIREKGLQGKVNLKGRIENSDLRGMLSDYDLYICPTQMEMSPVNILEAKAAGLPVVSSNVGGVPDMIRANVDGLLFEVDNIDDACSKIINLLEDSALREKLGKNARHHVSEVYTSLESSARLKAKITQIVCRKK